MRNGKNEPQQRQKTNVVKTLILQVHTLYQWMFFVHLPQRNEYDDNAYVQCTQSRWTKEIKRILMKALRV